MRPSILALAALSLACGSSAMAAAPAAGSSPARVRSFAALPDWSGLWKVRGRPTLISTTDSVMFARGVRDHPPYKPDWEARYTADLLRGEDQGNATSANPLVDSHTVYCLGGLPRLVATPFDYSFAVTPEMTWIVAGGETRYIYTDGRPLPPADEMWPKFYGWSVGRWEGQTLVIETRGMKPGLWADTTPLTLSDQAVMRERITLIDKDTLENRITIEDPVAFTAPWSFTRHYERQPKDIWIEEKEICGGPDDRNPVVNGRVTVQLPKQ